MKYFIFLLRKVRAQELMHFLIELKRLIVFFAFEHKCVLLSGQISFTSAQNQILLTEDTYNCALVDIAIIA